MRNVWTYVKCKAGSVIDHKHKADDHKTNVRVIASIFFPFENESPLSYLTHKPTRSVWTYVLLNSKWDFNFINTNVFIY